MNQGHQRAPNNNADGPNTIAFIGMVSWMRIQLEVHIVEIVLQRLITEVFVASMHGLEDYDDVCSGNDGSDGNVRNRNDDESNGNV
jgi:hypothetical protein